MKIKNKKANTVMVIIGIIIAVLSFFIISNFIFGVSDTVVTNADDIACRALISTLDLSKMETPVFLYKLEKKCKIDTSQTIDLSKKDESFKTISNDLERCFYRYGDGKKDFMSGLRTTGNWCFTCAKIKYKDNDKSIRYNDFVEWTKNHPKNLGKGEKTFYDKINIVYSNEKVNSSLRSQYEELKNEIKDTPSLNPMLSAVSEQINYINDLNGKTLDSNDKNLYVVFRYDRLQKNFSQKISDAKTAAEVGGVAGALVSITTETVAETVIFGGAGAAVSGPGGFFTGAIGTVVGFLKGIFKVTVSAAEITKRLIKLGEFSKKLMKLVKYSSKSLDTGETIIKIADKADIVKIIDQLDGSTKDGAELIKKLNNLKKGIDDTKAKNIEELIKQTEIKESNIDKIKSLLPKNLEKLSKGQKKNLNAHTASYKKYKDLEKNWKKVQDELNNIKTPTDKEKSLVKDYIRVSPIIIGAMGGAVIGADLINENYHQYVDVMTPEQYSRLCGPSPVN